MGRSISHLGVMDLAARVEGLHTPTAVLDEVSEFSCHHFDVGLFGTWHLPGTFSGQEDTWIPGETTFMHRSVPKDFFQRFREHYKANGYSSMSLKGRQESAPFTLAEAEKDAKKQRLHNRWIFPFLREYRIMDGLYCPFRRWVCVFISPKLLALSLGERFILSTAGQITVGRIESLTMKSRKRRALRKAPSLTPREAEVLQQLVILGDNAAVAASLNISLHSVNMHLTSVRKKLGVKSTVQAVLAAHKWRLIE